MDCVQSENEHKESNFKNLLIYFLFVCFGSSDWDTEAGNLNAKNTWTLLLTQLPGNLNKELLGLLVLMVMICSPYRFLSKEFLLIQLWVNPHHCAWNEKDIHFIKTNTHQMCVFLMMDGWMDGWGYEHSYSEPVIQYHDKAKMGPLADAPCWSALTWLYHVTLLKCPEICLHFAIRTTLVLATHMSVHVAPQNCFITSVWQHLLALFSIVSQVLYLRNSNFYFVLILSDSVLFHRVNLRSHENET